MKGEQLTREMREMWENPPQVNVDAFLDHMVASGIIPAHYLKKNKRTPWQYITGKLWWAWYVVSDIAQNPFVAFCVGVALTAFMFWLGAVTGVITSVR